ncbi:MAG: peptidylprolyl isomerase [Proteobacteria bacterium]|uniref:peptidylprolyl isomerase n=1 Tax=Rudaea sp. TaxID=2136325 RepID=UPI001D56ABD2|nr:peptidylprolyl isomerase [Pseudomonadota bacterium]MBS0567090.1 peptidylprolyl isomerase [Pseudomonadota bacterium]
MNKLFAAFLALLLTAAVPAARAQIQPIEPLDHIVAIAEDDVILQSELDRAVAQIQAQYRSNPQQLPPTDVLRSQVLDRLIMNRIQIQRAQSTGIRVTDNDIDQAIQRIAQSNNIDITQLRGALARDGIDYDDFRKQTKETLLTQRLQQRIMQGAGNVTDAEVDAMLATGNVRTGEIHLAHILIATPENASAEQIKAAKDKADDVKKQIDGGLDFAAAAIRYSNGQDALEGGDLQWRPLNALPEAFVQIAETLAPGQVSQVIRGPNGFHIIKVIDKRGGGKQVVTEYHARHIMIPVTELVSSAEAQKTVADLRRRIVDGHEDFAKLAKEYSKDPPTANLGGDMGWFPIDRFGTAVATALSSLKSNNDVSQPFQTDVGWHILQLLGKRESDRTVENQREQARELIRQRKAEDEIESTLRQFRSDSYICAVDPAYVTKERPACSGAAVKKAESK